MLANNFKTLFSFSLSCFPNRVLEMYQKGSICHRSTYLVIGFTFADLVVGVAVLGFTFKGVAASARGQT
jgi:hypothetical protein